MNRTQAMRKAQKLFGKNAAITDYGTPSSHESREMARSEFKALRDKCTTPEIRRANQKEWDRLGHESRHYRYSVGVVTMGLFNSIKACGDSWEGCFRAMEEQPDKGTAYEQPKELSPA